MNQWKCQFLISRYLHLSRLLGGVCYKREREIFYLKYMKDKKINLPFKTLNLENIEHSS